MKKNSLLFSQQATALVMALVVVAFLAIIAMSLFNRSINENRLALRERLQAEAFYLAEGAIEDAVRRFIQEIADFNIGASVARYPATGTLTTTYSSSNIFPSGATASWYVSEIATNPPRTVTDPDGTQVLEKDYEVVATVNHPLYPTVAITLHRQICRRLTHAFQYMVFYDNDLEILPGPTMNFSGRIHSNSDIYLGTHATLTVNSNYLYSVANIYNRRKDAPSTPMNGTVNIKIFGSESYAAMDGLDSEDANWATESQTRWNGTVKSTVHGVSRLAVPSVASIQPDGYYSENAQDNGIYIVNDTVKENGTILYEGVDIPIGTVAPSTTFYNNREGKWIKMTDINVDKLDGGYFDGKNYLNHLPANGLIYATRNDALSSEEPGVRLLNASEIKRSDGLTVVSNDPVYIQSNFNDVAKKPCAVICDSVNLLSNQWTDTNSTQSLNNRTVTQTTTINLCFIAGVDTTSEGHYNGGLENYPRFHEKWDGQTLYIRGAFVNIWPTQIASGAWVYGSPQYTAPNRNWDYDTALSSGTMPPFTPFAVEARRGAWWR